MKKKNRIHFDYDTQPKLIPFTISKLQLKPKKKNRFQVLDITQVHSAVCFRFLKQPKYTLKFQNYLKLFKI